MESLTSLLHALLCPSSLEHIYNISMASPRSKDEIIQSILDLALKTDKFTIVKGEDADLVVEKRL
jgi:hypothetical protein